MQIVLLLILFIFALNIPVISFFAIVAAFLALILKKFLLKENLRSTIFSKRFIIAYLILFSFSISYFLTISSYHLIDDDIPRTILLVNVSYLVGYNIKLEAKANKFLNYIYFYLALIGGGVAFVFLSIKSSSMLDVVGRSVPNVWKPGESPINGPVLDLYSMLGTGLVPFIFYSKNLGIHSGNHKLTIFVSSTIGFISLFTSVILQGRKAILSVLIAFLLTTFFKVINIKKKDGRDFYVFILLLGSFLFVIASGSIFEFIIGNFEMFARFKDEGLESGRYQAWADILESMPNYLTGGRAFRISESYAHNIWLDTFYDGGIIPMVLLLIFHGLHIQPLFKIINSKLPESIIILAICVIVPIFVGFQGEPVLQASIFYFSITCCIFGLIMRLSQVADEYTIVAKKVQG